MPDKNETLQIFASTKKKNIQIIFECKLLALTKVSSAAGVRFSFFFCVCRINGENVGNIAFFPSSVRCHKTTTEMATTKLFKLAQTLLKLGIDVCD